MASRHPKLLLRRLAAWHLTDCAGRWLRNASTVLCLLWAQEYCPSGHRCSNQMFTKREYGKIEVVRAWLDVCMFLGCIVVLSSCRNDARCGHGKLQMLLLLLLLVLVA